MRPTNASNSSLFTAPKGFKQQPLGVNPGYAQQQVPFLLGHVRASESLIWVQILAPVVEKFASGDYSMSQGLSFLVCKMDVIKVPTCLEGLNELLYTIVPVTW